MKNIDHLAIEIHGLTKYYGSARGISELELKVKKGEIFGFLGPNGAGKTTTIRLLMGLLKPSGGSIDIFNKKLAYSRRDIIRNTGYLPGDFGLYQDLSGRDLLRHFINIRTLHNYNIISDKTDELIQLFGFNLESKIKTYSKGMKQIVGIIQAFCHSPELIILDEPTSGLDPLAQEKFYELLNREKQKGTTIFFSSHILKEVERICDRVGIIKNGNLVFVEDLKEYRSIIGKKISLELPGKEPVDIVKRLKDDFGVAEIIFVEGKIKFFFKGDVRELLEYMGTIPIKDILIEVPAIEDVFMTYYKREEKSV
jgi:ABC-2 type transport system ATP-binding protein